MNTPVLFTVTEAAAVLRIGRTTAYELARRDLATDGGEGLGVVRIGGQLRIPRASLEQIIGASIETTAAGDAGAGKSLVQPVVPAAADVSESPAQVNVSATSAHTQHRPTRRRRSSDTPAPTLPFPT